MSDLAYHLWEDRGCPLGSPDVDWFLAEALVKEFLAETPFDEFLERATAALNSPNLVQAQPNGPEYARIMEERRYVIDVVGRVQTLAFGYSRLRALSEVYREAQSQIDRAKRAVRQQPLTWNVPDEIVWRRDRHALEARLLAAFVYYELTSLANMICREPLNIPIPNGELNYLKCVRDKLLAHSASGSLIRNADIAMVVPRSWPLARIRHQRRGA